MIKLPKLGNKTVEFISEQVPSYDRRIVLVGSPEKLKSLSGAWDWKKDLKGFIPIYNYYHSYKVLREELKNGRVEWISTKELPPAIDIEKARKKFKFPVNHPIDGVMYSCSDLEPDLYVPVANFHEYMYQARLNAFVEMCHNLGAKEIKILYAEENGNDVTAKVKGSDIPTPKGKLDGEINGGYRTHSTTEANVFYSFEPPSKPLTAYNKTWINAEPTWKTLQSLRLDGNIIRSKAEFNHTDEMSITTDVAADLSKIGLSLGGTYSEFVKKKFTFQVDFWPKH